MNVFGEGERFRFFNHLSSGDAVNLYVPAHMLYKSGGPMVATRWWPWWSEHWIIVSK